jgi:uncharacterized membrane protein YphA (DoxX/SURF4 family)
LKPNDTMIKKILFTVLTILLGLVFIFSGFTKLYPIELFELTLIDIKVSTWATAPIMSRLMIASEFLLGVLLVMNFKLRKFTLKASLIVLIIFTIYLIILMLVEGNKGNCKCFGNVIFMTPLESILKNLVMIALTIVLLVWHKGFVYPFQKIILAAVIIGSLVLPFILNPPDFIMAYQTRQETVGYKMDLDTLYNSPDIQKPEVELRKGKHIVAFMSLSCSHCKVAAYKMHIIKKQDPEIPFYFIFNGSENKLQPFFDETKASNIPHMILNGERFINLAGYVMPSIVFINNSMVEKKTDYLNLSEAEIKPWYAK